MIFTKQLLENALAIRPCNYVASSEPLLPKVARCITVLPLRYIGKCTARVLKRSGLNHKAWFPFAAKSTTTTQKTKRSCG